MDSYQAIYDAVRSRISNGDVGGAVSEAARNAFDISWTIEALKQEFLVSAYEMRRPSVLFKPALSADGDMWMMLLGENLQVGIAGFGETPEKAAIAFDLAFLNDRTPTAMRLAKGGQGDE